MLHLRRSIAVSSVAFLVPLAVFAQSYSSSSSSSYGYCGDNVCGMNEDATTCPADCAVCSSSSSSYSSSYSTSSSSYSWDSSSSSSSYSSMSSSVSSSSSSATCGDYIIEGSEECDDGPLGDDNCTALCAVPDICYCECGTKDTANKDVTLCKEKPMAQFPQCFAFKRPDAKTKAACDADVGKACTGYVKGDTTSNQTYNGTFAKCTFAKGTTSSDVSSSTSSSYSYSSSSSSF